MSHPSVEPWRALQRLRESTSSQAHAVLAEICHNSSQVRRDAVGVLDRIQKERRAREEESLSRRGGRSEAPTPSVELVPPEMRVVLSRKRRRCSEGLVEPGKASPDGGTRIPDPDVKLKRPPAGLLRRTPKRRKVNAVEIRSDDEDDCPEIMVQTPLESIEEGSKRPGTLSLPEHDERPKPSAMRDAVRPDAKEDQRISRRETTQKPAAPAGGTIHFFVCSNCDGVYAQEYNPPGCCTYHHGHLKVNPHSPIWDEWDERHQGPKLQSSTILERPEGFVWTCCEQEGTRQTCLRGKHANEKKLPRLEHQHVVRGYLGNIVKEWKREPWWLERYFTATGRHGNDRRDNKSRRRSGGGIDQRSRMGVNALGTTRGRPVVLI